MIVIQAKAANVVPYTHVIPDTERAAANRLADCLLGAAPDSRNSRE